MSKIDQKRAAARKKPEVIEDHPWYRLLAVTDNLKLELRLIFEGSQGKMFTYEYIDEFSDLKRPSTKFGKELSMLETQISDEISKNIFKVISNDNTNTNSKSADSSASVGDSKINNIPAGTTQRLF